MIIMPFTDPRATDPNFAGGKGANLARLLLAGFPVPTGFLLPSNLYRELFCTADGGTTLASRLTGIDARDPIALESVSVDLQAIVRSTPIPSAWENEIREAYRSLGGGLVAVRSSATAEDMPDYSFAGQQDTYLNVTGEVDLLRAVRNCWASLWTARAIGYRARNRIPEAGLALAVVVQQMVASEMSGVLFTANPLTGRRLETVIDSIPGLGEALVSGQTEPDHYVVETDSLAIRSSHFGSRHLGLQGEVGHESSRLRLTNEQVSQLTELGSRIAASQGSPQDIEWAFAEGKLHLLQARAITSLYPVPDAMLTGPLRVMFSFNSVQGLMDPITPFGQDSFQRLISGMGGMLGFRITPDNQALLFQAGERLWINISRLYRHKLGRKVLLGALGFVDPGAKLALAPLAEDPQFEPHGQWPSIGVMIQFFRHGAPIGFRVARYLLRPVQTLQSAIAMSERFLLRVQQACAGSGDPDADLLQRVRLVSVMTAQLPDEIPGFITGLMAGMASFNIFRLLCHRWLPEMGDRIPTWTLEATRGLPNNVTTEMDLALFATSRKIRADCIGCNRLRTTEAERLAAAYLAGTLPPITQEAVAAFMDRYGVRGLAEIDLGRTRWREDPTPVFQTLQSYIEIEDGSQAPDQVFARGTARAEEVLAHLFSSVRKRSGGWWKERVLRLFANRMRALMGIRESPKFLIIRMTGILREAFLESGRRFVSLNVLSRAEDIFFLHFCEIESIGNRNYDGWKAIVLQRRANFEREQRRKRIPRILLSDGRAFFKSTPSANAASAGRLTGDPVSPGVAEGRAHVIRDPRGACMAAGEILVCPGTDPSWTPLFLSAAGLVMEVGGMMTHGSVVAREYGIPAVVGVDFVTERIKTGDLIRVDGTRGNVEVLSPKEPSVPD